MVNRPTKSEIKIRKDLISSIIESSTIGLTMQSIVRLVQQTNPELGLTYQQIQKIVWKLKEKEMIQYIKPMYYSIKLFNSYDQRNFRLLLGLDTIAYQICLCLSKTEYKDIHQLRSALTLLDEEKVQYILEPKNRTALYTYLNRLIDRRIVGRIGKRPNYRYYLNQSC